MRRGYEDKAVTKEDYRDKSRSRARGARKNNDGPRRTRRRRDKDGKQTEQKGIANDGRNRPETDDGTGVPGK